MFNTLQRSGIIGAVSAIALFAQPTIAADEFAAPSGEYITEAGHRYISFTYSHGGFSNPNIRWADWTGTLDWDAENPAGSSIDVVIDAASVDTGVDEFDGHLKAESFFNVEAHRKLPLSQHRLRKRVKTQAKSRVI